MTSPPIEEQSEEAMQKGDTIDVPLQLDPDEFREDLAEFGLNREQEDELLQTLWAIMRTFVEIGWGVENTQRFLPDLFEKSSQESGKLVEIKDTQVLNQLAESHTEKVIKDEQSE